MANFIPPIPLGQFAPSSETIASWLYQVWQYLQSNPIPGSGEIEVDINEIISQTVPAMIQTAIDNLDYAQFVDGSTLPVYRASNDEIDNTDLLEAWNEGCRFALVDDEAFYIMINNNNVITLLQVLTQQQASSVISVNGQTGVVVLNIPNSSDDLSNDSNVSGPTITAALNTLNSGLSSANLRVEKGIIYAQISNYNGTTIRVPASGTSEFITTNHVLLNAILTYPQYQSGDLVVTTYDGYFELSGNVMDQTNVMLVLGLGHAVQ